jgi:membrane fusion protein (multidrug efflux system)
MTIRAKRYTAVAALLSMLTVAVVLKLTESSGRAQGGSVSAESKAKLITQIEVTRSEIVDRYTVLGTVKPHESIEIRNEVGGRVERLGFKEGKTVDAGDVLLKIDDAELQARKRATTKEYEVAKLQKKRQKKVLEKGGISQLQYELIASEAEVLKAQRDEIRAQIENTVIRAPFDGLVGVRQISEGAVIPVNTTAATLHQIDPAELEFDLPEKYLDRLSEGDKVRFRLRGQDDIYSAEVFAMSNQVDEGTRTLRVRAKTSNSDQKMRPGQMAAIEVVLERIKDAMTVPTAAVLKSRTQDYVFVNDDGVAKKTPVDIGIRLSSRVQIVDGLEAGQRVISTGLQDLSDGQKVKVDTSKDAIDVEQIQPDANRRGILRDVFSESKMDGDTDS